MKNKLILYGIFFILLIGGFWFALSFQKGFFEVKLPVMNYVQNFSFTDQNGQTVTGHNVDGKVYVTNYFFTTCKGICPKMNGNMKTVFDKFKDDKNSSLNIKEAFIHTQFFALVDKQKRVRGIYDGLKQDEIARLETDIGDLLKDKNP